MATSGSPTSTAPSPPIRRLCAAAGGPPRRVPNAGTGPARADQIPSGRPNDHRPPRRLGLPAGHQRAARLGGGSGADRGLRRDPAQAPGPAPVRQGQQARDIYRMVARITKDAGTPGTSAPTRCGRRRSPTPSTPASPSGMRRSWPGTPTRERPSTTTVPEATSTGTASTS